MVLMVLTMIEGGLIRTSPRDVLSCGVPHKEHMQGGCGHMKCYECKNVENLLYHLH